MSNRRKNIWYYVITVIFCSVFIVSFNLGITHNPNFNIHDFCMGLASELVGLVFAVIIVDSYIKMKTERAQAKKLKRAASQQPDLAQSGFEVIGGNSFGMVKSISTLQDTQTGVQYILVQNESGLTLLLDQEGRPVIGEQSK